jgi:outer membrane protein assembly factor BamB
VLYALGSDGDLMCMELTGGKIRWQKNLRTDFGGEPGQWAYAESPLIDGDALVCTPGGSDATMIALNKKTGETIWKCPMPDAEAAGYASIVSTQSGGIKQYVQLVGKSVIGVDARTGKFLWRYSKASPRDMPNIPTPVVDGNFVYAVPKRLGGILIKLNASDPTAEPEEVYFESKLPKAIGGAVKLGDYLYGASDQGLLCVEFATGDVQWSNRSLGAASVFYADGNLYLHGENDGDVALVEATPQAYHEKGRFTPPGQPERPNNAKAWAYPVVANGRHYIRDQEMLWCYDVKAQRASP